MGFLCGYPNSCGVIRPPFQGSDVFAWQTQGAALGCDGSSRRDSKPQSSRTKNQEPRTKNQEPRKAPLRNNGNAVGRGESLPERGPKWGPENGLKDTSVL
jgi:hypothetical protein